MNNTIDILKSHPVIWDVIKLILTAIATGVVLSLVLRLERRAVKKLRERKNNINIRFVESTVRFALILIAVMWVVMSSPLTQPFGRIVFQGTAIIGAIVGFAAQPVIADLICGLMISTTQPFNIGDRIELEDGTAGIVKDITLRHVVLQTIDTLRVVIPNSKLNAMRVTNMSYHTTTRSIAFRFHVAYNADAEHAKAVILNAIKESPYSIPGREGEAYSPVYFLQFGESSLEMATTVYYEPSNPSEVVKNDINCRVKNALEAAGIEIPYNYVNVVMRGEQ